MAITTYAELKAAVKSWGKRSDIPSKVDDFIDLTEAELWQRLKIKEMEATATATTSTSVRILALPSLYISFRRVLIIVDGVYYPLQYKNPEDLCILDYATIPTQYTIGDDIEFNCISDQAYTVEFEYYKQLDPLSDSNTTNAVLTNHPMLYLAGCLKECGLWAKDFEMASLWEARFDTTLGNANRNARKGRYPPGAKPSIEGMIV